MAGIGFAIRKLTSRGDLFGLARGYLHAAFAASGAWIFTILTLAALTVIGPRVGAYDDVQTFRLVVVYDFAFSLVLTGPVTMVVTRYTSDCLFANDVSGLPGCLLGGLVLVYATQAPVALWFYTTVATLDGLTAAAAVICYLLVAGTWVVSVFLSTLKEFAAVSRAFALGMAISLASAVGLAPSLGAAGMLLGFALGLVVIQFTLIARVFAEFPYAALAPFAFLPYFRRHWELAAGGAVYYAAIWVDKWVMWGAPERERLTSGLVSYPDYDSALFLACLTMVPSMAVFIVAVETDFFERYQRFYRGISRHATYDEIVRNQQGLVGSVFEGARKLLLLQGGLAAATIVSAPWVFDLIGVNYAQMGMFRLGVLAVVFHLLFVFLSILLSYLDLNRSVLWLSTVLLVANAAFTWAARTAGFAYYGYGYFLAAVVTFLVAVFVAMRYLDDLPYHTFISGNASVRSS
jgi:uncharacterized membrane protein